jgi:hypothetical protein
MEDYLSQIIIVIDFVMISIARFCDPKAANPCDDTATASI